MSKRTFWSLVIVVFAFAIANACGGGKRGASRADRADRALADELRGSAPGSLAKYTVTRGMTETFEKGEWVSTVSFWTCDGETAEEIATCQKIGEDDPDCTKTATGTNCQWR
jgi:hypothetical protein